MLPLNIMLDYLKLETGTEITILGIQPQNLSYDGKMTESVLTAIDEVALAITDTLKAIYK